MKYLKTTPKNKNYINQNYEYSKRNTNIKQNKKPCVAPQTGRAIARYTHVLVVVVFMYQYA